MKTSYSPSTVLSLVALLVSQSQCLQVTFPEPERADYVFTEGDIALVEWTPREVIHQLALNCGPTLDINQDTPAYRLDVPTLSSLVPYRIPQFWAESYHNYCTFCIGTSRKACSGIFLVAKPDLGYQPMVHSISGTFSPFTNKTIPSDSASLMLDPTSSSYSISTSVAAITEYPERPSTMLTTSSSSYLYLSSGYSNHSHCNITASVTTYSPVRVGNANDPSGYGTASGSKNPPVPTGYPNGTSGSTTITASYNFPTPTPTPSPLPTSGSSAISAYLESSLAGVIAIAVLMFLSF